MMALLCRALFLKPQRFISQLLLPCSRFSSFPTSKQHRLTSPNLFKAASQRGTFCTMNRKPGDWDCPSCQHLNFSWRESCQRCNDPRPKSGPGSLAEEGGAFGGFSRRSGFGGGGYGYGERDVRPGDWHCSCGVLNFASRSSCFKCGAAKDEGADGDRGEGGYQSGIRSSRGNFGLNSYNSGGGRAAFKSGDWICSRAGCNEHNFASRTECFRCQAPRESGTAV